MPENLAAKLAAVARKRGRSKSAVIRQLLEEQLDRGLAVPADSCLELAADLVGCVEGPGDLSFNKRRLEGLGR